VRFNVLGILDLVVAGIMGFLLLGLIEVTPSTEALTLLPLALIPTAAVPLTVALHIVSLRRLLDFGWIKLPIFDDGGYPIHHRGVVDAAPGLYFLGLPFQYTPTSEHVGGVGKDAQYISEHIAARSPTRSGRRRDDRLPMHAEQQA
jgi:hypothetical protein